MRQEEFFAQVYKIVAHIPEGRVMTYGQIAFLVGFPNSSRRVGNAMFHTPGHLNIPSHRVVNSQGGLAPSGAFGGAGVQRKWLEEEGVVFKSNGCVNLKKSQYHSIP